MLSLVATLRGSPRVGSIRVAQRHGHPYMGGGFGNGSYWKFVVALGHEFTQHAAGQPLARWRGLKPPPQQPALLYWGVAESKARHH